MAAVMQLWVNRFPSDVQRLGMELEGEIHVESSAALGVVGRRGAGKLRQVRVGQLQIQEKTENGELVYTKVKGISNPTDAMIKALCGSEI